MSSDTLRSRPAAGQGFADALYLAAVLESERVLRAGAWASGRELELDDLALIAETLERIRAALYA